MYYDYSLNLTEHQKKKIVNVHKHKTGVKIRLANSSLNLNGNVTFRLTAQQINRTKKAKASGHGIEIKFSNTQLQKQEGFLSAILNLRIFVLPFLAKKVVPTLGLAAAFGAIQAATNKAVRNS